MGGPAACLNETHVLVVSRGDEPRPDIAVGCLFRDLLPFAVGNGGSVVVRLAERLVARRARLRQPQFAQELPLVWL